MTNLDNTLHVAIVFRCSSSVPRRHMLQWETLRYERVHLLRESSDPKDRQRRMLRATAIQLDRRNLL